MHKKSLENIHTSPGKAQSLTPPPASPAQEKLVDKVIEEDKPKQNKDTGSPISKEELRENSIAALRAKAMEHSAKMLGTVSDRTNIHVPRKEEAEEELTEKETAKVRRNWKRLRDALCRVAVLMFRGGSLIVLVKLNLDARGVTLCYHTFP